jgi:hypothetical protein
MASFEDILPIQLDERTAPYVCRKAGKELCLIEEREEWDNRTSNAIFGEHSL